MKISELQKILTEVMEKEGDIKVYRGSEDYSWVGVDTWKISNVDTPDYYDKSKKQWHYKEFKAIILDE
jgi:hypothetical protein